MQHTLVNMPKTKRGEMTLDKICRAAEQTFGKNGYYNTYINDIAREAEVAPGTIYIYFDDKYSIYRYLLSQYSHDIRKQIALAIKDSTCRKDAERQGLKRFLELIKEKRFMYNIIWESLYIDKKLFVEYYEDFRLKYVTRIEAAQQEGQMYDYDTTVVAYVLMGISNFIGLKYVMFDDVESFDHIVDEVMDILDQGLFK